MATASPSAVPAIADRPIAERPDIRDSDTSSGQFAGLMAQFLQAPKTPEASGGPPIRKGAAEKDAPADSATPPGSDDPAAQSAQAAQGASSVAGQQSSTSPPPEANPNPAVAPAMAIQSPAAPATAFPVDPAATPAPMPGPQANPGTGQASAFASGSPFIPSPDTAAPSSDTSSTPEGKAVPAPASARVQATPQAPVQVAIPESSPSSTTAPALPPSGNASSIPVVKLISAEQPEPVAIPSIPNAAPDPASSPVAESTAKGNQSAGPSLLARTALPSPSPEQTEAPAPQPRPDAAAPAAASTQSEAVVVAAQIKPIAKEAAQDAEALAPSLPATQAAAESAPRMKEALKPGPRALSLEEPKAENALPLANDAKAIEVPAHSLSPSPSPANPGATQTEIEAATAKAGPVSQNILAHAGDGSALAALGAQTKTVEMAPVAATTPIAPSTPAAPPSATTTQMEGGLKWMLKSGVQEAQLQLHPESLGKVTIHLKIEGGEVHARLWVSEPASVQAIQEGRPHLEMSLKEQGLQLGSFDLHQGHRPFQEAPSAPFVRGNASPNLPAAGQEAPATILPSALNPHRVELYA